MCLRSLHSTARENRPINNRYDHCFELLFGCLRSRANALFCLLQQSAHRSSRKGEDDGAVSTKGLTSQSGSKVHARYAERALLHLRNGLTRTPLTFVYAPSDPPFFFQKKTSFLPLNFCAFCTSASCYSDVFRFTPAADGGCHFAGLTETN